MLKQLSEKLIGSTFNRVNISEIKALVLPLPPRAEQDAITRCLDDRLRRYDELSTQAARQLVLIREFRTRLICDIVTGKLDVREVAANLPDDPDAADPALEKRLEEVAAG